MAAPQDPNRIDVSLNIMSDATLQAVNELTNQLSGLRELIASQSMTDPAQAAQSAGRAAAYTRPGGVQAGIHHGPSAPIQQGDPSNPSQGAQTSAQRRAELKAEYQAYMDDIKSGIPPRGGELSPDAEQAMMNNIGDIQRMRVAVGEKKQGFVGSAVDRFFKLYPGVSRDPGEDRTYEQVSGSPTRGGSSLPEGMTTPSGTPSSGASFFGNTPGGNLPGGSGWQYSPSGVVIPSGSGGGQGRPPNRPAPAGDFGGNTDGGGPNMPGWHDALSREGITPESRLGLTIPRLGEFTIQDKLNMYAQWMGRAAMRRDDADMPGQTTSLMGRTAAGAAYLRDQSASLVAINREFQRVREFARGQELTGEQLGYSRESSLGDVNVLGAGFRLNLGVTSDAQREALHQELTQRRVQAAPGVSGEEARRIRQTVAGLGYSGDMNARLQLDLFRPLQQRGIDPESAAPLLDQGIRQGNSSIATLRDTMIDLASAARNANMTLSDVTQSSLEYAESVQSIGANYESALRNATTFTRSGLDPRIAGQAMQSPMVQGLLSMQTGLPPQLQGIIAAPGVMNAMGQAIQQGLALGAPFANLPDSTITSASGQKITTSTGRDAQIAMAQQTTGIPRQIIERYMRNPNFLEAGGTAQTMVGQMQDEIRAQTHHERQVPVYENFGPRNEVMVPGPNGLERRNLTPRQRIGERTESYTSNLTAAQRQALESGSNKDNVIQYNELEAQMLAMDPKNKQWTDRVRKISKDHGNVEDRLKVASRIIGEATNVKPEPDYMIGLTAEAAKILKIVKPKDRNAALPRANAGGAPANAAMQGPTFPSSTGGAMSYGVPGGP